jgi:hypothetical protein
MNGEIVPSGFDWPIFIYAGETFDSDDPWNGLLRGHILVLVRHISNVEICVFALSGHFSPHFCFPL